MIPPRDDKPTGLEGAQLAAYATLRCARGFGRNLAIRAAMALEAEGLLVDDTTLRATPMEAKQ